MKTNPQDGNYYTYKTTDAGIPTFLHEATGETLHAQAGPYQEAWNLYVTPSRLSSRAGKVVVYDGGMGCAAQLLAAKEAFEQNPKLTHMHVVSFDLEKLGIDALLLNLESFEFAQPHKTFLLAVQNSDLYSEKTADGREFSWQFVEGDFAEVIAQKNSYPKANVIFYDFFSPSNRPVLWSYEVLKNVFEQSDDDGILITYSCATCVRASMAAAGFYLGFGIPSGKKAKTTFAAKQFADLTEPIPVAWKQTFLKSQIPFVSTETPENQKIITDLIKAHPQFIEENSSNSV